MKKYLANCLTFMLFISWTAFTADFGDLSSFFAEPRFDDHLAEHLIFIGPSGVGKSILINSLIGDNVAPTGMGRAYETQFFNRYEHEGYLYLDSPPFTGISIEQTALEIEALRGGAEIRIFSVTTLEADRVHYNDVIDLNRVMDAIGYDGINYDVIINKVRVRTRRLLNANPNAEHLICNEFNNDSHEITNFCFVDWDGDFEDGGRDFIDVDNGLRDFIFSERVVPTRVRQLWPTTNAYKQLAQDLNAGDVLPFSLPGDIWKVIAGYLERDDLLVFLLSVGNKALLKTLLPTILKNAPIRIIVQYLRDNEPEALSPMIFRGDL